MDNDGEQGIRPDLTPMIDCVFLLLVFFMVTTVFTESQRFRVRLPPAEHVQLIREKKLNIVLSPTGEVDLNGEVVPISALSSRIEDEKVRAQSTTVLIRADGDTPHGVLLDVMDAVRKAGIEEINLATREMRGNER